MDFEKIKQEIKDKPFIPKDYVLIKLQELKKEFEAKLEEGGYVLNVGKVLYVDKIQKYDVVSALVFNCPHPCLVYKIVDDVVYAFGLSTKLHLSSVYTIESSRIFKGNTISTTLVTLTKEEASKNFLCIFDNKREAAKAIKHVENFYKTLIK